MADEKTQNKPADPGRNKEVQSRDGISQNSGAKKTNTSNDISEVDQQEGSMNNGESGGNLIEEKSAH